MDYIKEINAFHDSLSWNPLSTGQVAVWHILMYICNKASWAEWFTVPNQTLEVLTGLSRKGIQIARNALVQKGYIEVRTRGTKATMYKMVSRLTMQHSTQVCTQDCTRNTTQVCTQDCTQLNKRNETNIPPYIPPQGESIEPDAFDTFWEMYPRKVAKEKARSAFKRIPKRDYHHLFAGLKAQKQSEQWCKAGGQFIPHPTTWLNQRRWEDEPIEVKQAEPESYYERL